MNALLLAITLMAPLSSEPSTATSQQTGALNCPAGDGYLPLPHIFCRAPGGAVWHEQGNTCHDNPADRRPRACECAVEGAPTRRLVTYCKAPDGF